MWISTFFGIHTYTDPSMGCDIRRISDHLQRMNSFGISLMMITDHLRMILGKTTNSFRGHKHEELWQSGIQTASRLRQTCSRIPPWFFTIEGAKEQIYQYSTIFNYIQLPIQENPRFSMFCFRNGQRLNTYCDAEVEGLGGEFSKSHRFSCTSTESVSKQVWFKTDVTAPTKYLGGYILGEYLRILGFWIIHSLPHHRLYHFWATPECVLKQEQHSMFPFQFQLSKASLGN